MAGDRKNSHRIPTTNLQPRRLKMQKITPCLWFDDRIEDAVNFYVSVFKDGKILESSQQGGKMFVARFVIHGQEFQALNGGPQFRFNEAVSFSVDCKDQAEVDYYWNTLTADGGEESQCGWVKDKFGLSWQIIPEALPRLLSGSDKAGAERTMQAMLKMGKIIVADLEKAYAGT
jgi:predicted 3-demethylubiquinone-9 3-methyltransferase (glyoxalase superfamily)